MQRVLVRGIGDHGSAVAHALFRAGYGVVIHCDPLPADCHRAMAFTDAVYDGSAVLEDVTAVRVNLRDRLIATLDDHQTIPVVTDPLAGVLTVLRPDVLVDVRMRKREQPERQRGLAPLTIGLGPGYVAGDTVDLAVETGFGDDFGRVYDQGTTRPQEGEPPPIGGHGRERFLYAPSAGILRTERHLGEAVGAGDLIARIDSVELRAAVAGWLRGLTHDGALVTPGFRIAEVNPVETLRKDRIGPRQARMGAVVLESIARWSAAQSGGV
jgi:xanthine dehydrogenase accessory factor